MMRLFVCFAVLCLVVPRLAHAQRNALEQQEPSSTRPAAPDLRAAPEPYDSAAPRPLLVPESIEDVVPMPPGPLPQYSSLHAYREDLYSQLSVLRLRELQLRSLADPAPRRRRIILGAVVGGVGLVGVFLASSYLLDVGRFQPDDVVRKVNALTGVSGVVSLAGLSVMIWGLCTRPYHEELRQVIQRREQTQRELNRVTQLARRATIQLSTRGVGLHVWF